MGEPATGARRWQSHRWQRHPFDIAAQTWMVATSRPVDAVEVPWLVGPIAGNDVVGHGWVEREAVSIGGRTSTGPDHGLLPDFGCLAAPSFDPSRVHPAIVDFYEHTAHWQLDLWSEWCRLPGRSAGC